MISRHVLAIIAGLGFVVVGTGPLRVLAQPAGAGEGAKICAWFTPAEISKYLGAAVETGVVNGPLDSQCQWLSKSPGAGSISIQIVSRNHWEVPSLADGFKRLGGIAEAAYIVPQFGGWQAGARTATKVVAVAGRGGTLTADKTVELLRAAVNHP